MAEIINLSLFSMIEDQANGVLMGKRLCAYYASKTLNNLCGLDGYVAPFLTNRFNLTRVTRALKELEPTDNKEVVASVLVDITRKFYKDIQGLPFDDLTIFTFLTSPMIKSFFSLEKSQHNYPVSIVDIFKSGLLTTIFSLLMSIVVILIAARYQDKRNGHEINQQHIGPLN
jgi:hypothetical protein